MPATGFQFQACGIQDTKKPNIGEENAKEVKLVKCRGENVMFCWWWWWWCSHRATQPRLEKCEVETVFACCLVPSIAGTTQGVLERLVRGIFSISPVTRKPVPVLDKLEQAGISISK